jgi:hypothetical protein
MSGPGRSYRGRTLLAAAGEPGQRDRGYRFASGAEAWPNRVCPVLGRDDDLQDARGG